MSRAAAFLDRDGTIIRDAHYLSDPAQVELLPGAATAIRRLNDAGWPVIVVTNQSGIARGLLTRDDYEAVHGRMVALLDEDAGARIDAAYHGPHHPDFTGACECRKPGTLLFSRAAVDHDLDPAASWYVGDKLRDVLPSRALRGHGVLVPSASTPEADVVAARREFAVAASLDAAVARIIESSR